jgi:4-amino-4-deoxy-L-arabinose transferase-like glycosyltransferase
MPFARLTREAWMSIAAVVLFLAITLWWLTQDRAIPVFDAGLHLSLTINVYEKLRAGSIGSALTLSVPYPPLTYLVGTLGMWIGGIGVNSAILTANLVFVPLLALGCYKTAQLSFGTGAGLLAVLFALGSPLIAAQFHVFMTDAPETAMVALSVWLILASERFARFWLSAAAGIAVGLGLLTKEPFAFFVAGVVLVTVMRGGWRSWRGLMVFCALALALALPWYVSEFSQVHALAQGVASSAQPTTIKTGIFPARASASNLFWYFWNILNFQLFAPLFAFAAVGVVWTILALLRRRPLTPFSWELLIGALVGWIGISATYPHDTRYSLPLLVYLAVLGGGWIVKLPHKWRLAATGALVLVVIANTLSTSFGVGALARVKLPGAQADVVAGPVRDGDILGLMRALRAGGVQTIEWTSLSPSEPSPEQSADFSEAGLIALAQIAGLGPGEALALPRVPPHEAILQHGAIRSGQAPPCVRLSDGTGVWVLLANASGSAAEHYCPTRNPAVY